MIINKKYITLIFFIIFVTLDYIIREFFPNNKFKREYINFVSLDYLAL